MARAGFNFNPNDRVRRVTRNVYAYDNRGGGGKKAGAICWKHRENVERWDWETWNGRRDFQFSDETLFFPEQQLDDKKKIVMTSKIHNPCFYKKKKDNRTKDIFNGI